MNDLKVLIAQHPFLHGIKPEYLDVLAKSAKAIEFTAGQKVLRQHEAAYELYLITDGKLAIESHSPGSGDVPLQVIGGGDALGWSWLFPPFSSHLQARALEPTKAILLDGASLLVQCENDRAFGYELMKRVAEVVINRLHAARERLIEVHASEECFEAVDETKILRPDSEAGPTKTLLTQLTEHPFLKGMNPKHLGILANAAMRAHFAASELVFGEGDLANRFYLIQHGKVVLEFSKPEGRSIPVEIVGDGDVLGWSWLFPPFYCHFEARAVEPTQAIFLYGTRLREECEEDNDFGYDLMKRIAQVLIRRLQTTLRQLREHQKSEVTSTTLHPG